MEDAVNMCEATSRMSQPYARSGIHYLNAANVCTTDQMKFTVIVLNVDDSGTVDRICSVVMSFRSPILPISSLGVRETNIAQQTLEATCHRDLPENGAYSVHL